MFRHLETGAVIKAGAVILPPLSFKWIYIFLRAKQYDTSAQRYNRQILETLKADKAQTSCPHPSQITKKQWDKAPHPGVWDTITKNNLGEKTGFFLIKNQWHMEKVLEEMGGAFPNPTMQWESPCRTKLKPCCLIRCKRKTQWICWVILRPKALLSATWTIRQSPGACRELSSGRWRTTNAR